MGCCSFRHALFCADAGNGEKRRPPVRAASGIWWLEWLCRSHAEAEAADVLVDAAGNAEQEYAQAAHQQADAGVGVGRESGDGGVAFVDEHGLDNPQVVVERDDGVQQGDEDEDVESLFGGGGKDEEFAEEAGERGYSRQGEQRQHHDDAEARVGGVQSVVVVDGDLSAAVLHDGDDAEGGEVGQHVDEDVVDETRHSEGVSADDAQHDVARLRDGRVGEEALDVLLADGEYVGQGNREDDNAVEDGLPFLHEGGEDLKEKRHEDKGRRAFGYHGKVGRDAGGCALVGVRSPLVERNEREFEAQADEEEGEGHELDGRAVELCRDIGEIERAGGAVDEREPVERESGGEDGRKDVFGRRLGGLVAVFVVGHEGRRRNGGQLDSDEVHEEMARGNHEVHAEQCGEGDDVELPAAYDDFLALQPVAGLHEDEKGAEAEYRLHDVADGGVVVHSPEGDGLAAGQEVDQRVDEQEDAGHGLEVSQAFLRAEYVV